MLLVDKKTGKPALSYYPEDDDPILTVWTPIPGGGLNGFHAFKGDELFKNLVYLFCTTYLEITADDIRALAALLPPATKTEK